MGFPMGNHAPTTYRRFFTTLAPYSTKVVKWMWYTWTYQKPVKQAAQVWPWGKPSSVVPIIAHRRPTKCHSEWCNIRAIAHLFCSTTGVHPWPVPVSLVRKRPSGCGRGEYHHYVCRRQKDLQGGQVSCWYVDAWSKDSGLTLTRQNERLREYPGNWSQSSHRTASKGNSKSQWSPSAT